MLKISQTHLETWTECPQGERHLTIALHSDVLPGVAGGLPQLTMTLCSSTSPGMGGRCSNNAS